jgi:hypothetical protein
LPSLEGKKKVEKKNGEKNHTHTLTREWVPTSYAIKFPTLEWKKKLGKNSHTHTLTRVWVLVTLLSSLL